jgi:DNA-binding transcriptional regulator GbsR (MarR family)
MFFWIIQQIIISIVLIISIHYIYIFFKNNLTIPKTKDLVKRPIEQYKQIYTSLNKNLKKEENNKNMKDELKNYLKQLSNKNKHNQQNTDIANVGNIFHSKGNFTSY